MNVGITKLTKNVFKDCANLFFSVPNLQSCVKIYSYTVTLIEYIKANITYN